METDGFLQYCTLLPPEKTITTYYFSMLEEELNIEDDRVSIVICVFFLSRSSKVVLLLPIAIIHLGFSTTQYSL